MTSEKVRTRRLRLAERSAADRIASSLLKRLSIGRHLLLNDFAAVLDYFVGAREISQEPPSGTVAGRAARRLIWLWGWRLDTA